MKVLGVIGMSAGGLTIAVSAAQPSIEGLVIGVIGLLSLLCGAMCIRLHNVQTTLVALDTKLSNIEKGLQSLESSSTDTAAEQIADQLRQEGFISSHPRTTEQDLNELID